MNLQLKHRKSSFFNSKLILVKSAHILYELDTYKQEEVEN